MSLDVEIQYRDTQERYRTLAMYKIAVSEEELTGVESIEQKWLDLFAQAKHIDRSLVKVKKKFTVVSIPPYTKYTTVLKFQCCTIYPYSTFIMYGWTQYLAQCLCLTDHQ